MNWINDRFTFDNRFRILKKEGFSFQEAKDFILNNYSLSTLVIQERIENDFYKKISCDKIMSEDLFLLKNKVYNEAFLNKN
jgi:hypothetical protein